MKKSLIALSSMLMLGGTAHAQKVAFEEYDLSNGMHVIFHNDPSAPVVITSVMYHVGAKDEQPDRTGFAHFFEHLLFEGTENIKRGEWFKIVTSNGGTNNANTTEDRTYYYEVFPSNNLELGLWMESERMMHPVINQIGAFSYNQEDYGTYILYGMPQGEFTSKDIIKEVDEEIVKLQTDLISENDLQKLKNKYENNYVSGNASVEGIADNLASFYLLYGDVNLINTEIEMYNSITREEIREIAKKYLNPNQRLLLDYIPAKDKAESSPSESAKQNK